MKLLPVLCCMIMISSCAPQTTQVVGGTAAVYDGETQATGVLPTNDIRTSDFEAPTPLSIGGAQTVTTMQLHDALSSSTPPILIDVLGGNQTVSLPNAVWLRGAGLGNSYQDETQQHLATRLSELTRSNKDMAVAFFCLSKTCWLSHNAALRAVRLGYTKVLWYRGGRKAWIAAGLPMAPVKQTAF